MKYIIIALCCLAFFNSKGQSPFLLVGTYDSPQSEGIYVYSFDKKNGRSAEVSHIKTSNPSFLTVSNNRKFVYAVNENAAGSVTAFSLEKGQLRELSSTRSGCAHPCHIEPDQTGRWLFVSNYSSGTLSVLSVNGEGQLVFTDSIQHKGQGPVAGRQKGPHVHGAIISPDNTRLYVTDLGIDSLKIYSFDPVNGKLHSLPSFGAVPGSGPRSFCFHNNKNWAYMIEEISGTLEVFHNENGNMVQVQRIPTRAMPDSISPGSADLHVSPDGRYLYASNRGEVNDIGIYRIDQRTGKLKLAGSQSALGKGPRNFSIDPSGRYLLCANQHSNEIVVFRINKKTGMLKDSGERIKVGKPVCLKWVSP